MSPRYERWNQVDKKLKNAVVNAIGGKSGLADYLRTGVLFYEEDGVV